ncbi:MAG: hypothetical protein EOO11_01235 [Chitinophagaceae bacterium]|nr:MAG: hypothetical protein EOO11_01235 [Chitinophagaceae bacterium]
MYRFPNKVGKGLRLLLSLPFLLACLLVQGQSNITRVEYYVDSDPGYGNASSLSITPATQLSGLPISLDPSALSSGVHVLGVRAQDAGGAWSLDQRWLFFKPYPVSALATAAPDLVYAEYYIDQDPGFGSGTPVAVSGNQVSSLTVNLDPATLSEGVHQFHFRARDANGNWSLSQRWLFFKPYASVAAPTAAPALTYAEYYIDSDPGYGSATPVAVSGNNMSNLLVNIDPAALTPGVHKFGFRARDANGSWSLDQRWLFFKPYTQNPVTAAPRPNLVYLEYYIDEDPGIGLARSVPVPADTALSNLTIPVSLTGLTAGTHDFFLRGRDASGAWSLVNRLGFNVPPAFDQTVTISDTVPGTLCVNQPFTVAYTATGTYNPANTFRVELSDSTGSFTSPVSIGSVTSDTSGSITAVVPNYIPGGRHYRIRVVSDNPALISQDNGQDITVGFTAALLCPANIEVNAPAGACSAIVSFSASSDTSVTYSHQPGTAFPVGTTWVTVTSSNACGSTSCVFAVTVRDSIPPVAACRNISVTLDASGNASITGADVDNGSTDNCTIASRTVSPSHFTSANLGANNVTLTVTDSYGNSSTCTAVVQVNAAIYVQVNAGGTTCGGANGSATALVQGGTAPYTYVWNTLDTTASIGNLPAGTYTVTVTDAGGLSTSAQGVVASSAAPARPSITASGGANFCPGQPATLTVTPANSYSWSTGAATQSIAVNASGTYSVVTTTGGCTDSATINVTYVTPPATPVSVRASGPATFCQGSNVTLTASASGNALSFTNNGDRALIPRNIAGDFTIEYWMKTTAAGPGGSQWYHGSGLVDGEMGGVTNDFGTSLVGGKVAFGTGNPDVTILSATDVNDGNWHHVTATRQQATGIMRLYIDGVEHATATGGTGLLNAPGQLALGVLQTGANPTFIGQLDELRIWNGVRTASQVAASYNRSLGIGAALTDYYHFDETGGNALVNGATGGNGSILTGAMRVPSTLSLDAGALSYQWSNGASGPSINVGGSGDYSVSVSNGSCAATSAPLTVTVQPSGIVNTPASQTVCNGAATAAVNFTSPAAGTSYTWTNNNPSIGLPASGSGDIDSFIAVNNGTSALTATITVTPTATDGSAATCPGSAKSFTITVNPTPVASIQGGSGQQCAGSVVTLTASPADSYSWSTGATTQSIQVTSSGIYTVTVSINGCSATASKEVTILGNHAPALSFSGATSFTSSVMSPASGTPTTYYRFEVRYTDADGDLPQSNTIKLLLDYEGNGLFTNGGDRTFYLTEKDAADGDVTDGKDYYFVTNALPASASWQTSIQATDMGGCSASFGPFSGPVVQPRVDISIFANDISFSNPHPDTSSQLTVTATIRNNSGRDAGNFTVRLVNQNQASTVYPDITVPFLSGANGSIQVSWNITTPDLPMWCPMQVFIDAGNMLDESNELDNQAIRPFINGNYQLPGDIAISADPSPATIYTADPISIGGTAWYRNTAVQLLDSSCAGATVTVKIVETNQSVTTYTNSLGQYSATFGNGPATPGTYHVQVAITDYTLEGDTTTSFTVIPRPQCTGPDLSSNVELSPSTVTPQYPAYNTRYVVVGDALTGTVTVTNGGQTGAGAQQLYMELPAATPLPGPFSIAALGAGQATSVTLPAMTFGTIGTTYIRSTADGSNEVNELCGSAESNNSDLQSVVVLPNAPDIAPANHYSYSYANQCQGIPGVSFVVRNLGGRPTGTFNARLTVLRNGTVDTVINQSVANINALWEASVSFNYQYPGTAGVFSFVLDCDFPDAVAEYNEGNNSTSYQVQVNACEPDLTVYGCGNINVEPADPACPGNITVTAQLVNPSLVAISGPIAVAFNVAGTHYTYTYTGTLAAGASTPVTMTLPAPAHGDNTFTVTVDAAGTVAETNEHNNSATAKLCWDFEPTNYACGSSQFIAGSQIVNTPVTMATGLFNHGLYKATHAQVKFEVSGPGIAGWLNLGTASTPIANICSCPLGLSLPNPYVFTQTGTFYIRITADPNGQYTECNEGNNVISFPVEVRLPLPDYLVRSEHIAPSLLNPDMGQPISVDISYRNVGVSSVDSLTVYMQVNNDPHDSVRVGGLSSGELNTVHLTRTWSSNLRGVHVIRAVVDRHKEVAEGDELNNEATRAIVVGKAPNLYFESLTVSNPAPLAGSSLSIAAVVKNNGFENCAATVMFYYIDDAGEKQFIGQRNINVDSANTSVLQPLSWLVTDAHTQIVGEIINGNPSEYNLDDNEATVSIGGMQLFVTATPASCGTTADGVARVLIQGGQAPFSRVWSNGSTGDSIVVGPGTYTVTVSDASGTVATDTVIVASSGSSCNAIATLAGDTVLCAGSGSSVGYTATGTFGSGNQFIAQLSDASGSFASPATIGAVTATTSGSIAVSIPANMPGGSGYRIRVVSTSPAATGSDNGADIRIGARPVATIAYSGAPFCTGSPMLSVTHSGATGGTYSATPAGLDIDAATGAINPAQSAAGTYTITYTMDGANGCPGNEATTMVTLSAGPAAAISYSGSPYCAAGAATVALTGTPGGTFSASAGLSLDAATGAINLATSSPGSYTVTYTVAPSGQCPQVQATATVAVNPVPAVDAVSSQTVRNGLSTAALSFTGPVAGTSYEWTNSNPSIGLAASGTGDIASFIALNNGTTPATATLTVTPVYTANGGTCTGTAQTFTIAVDPFVVSTIVYEGSPYCARGVAAPVISGVIRGSFSAPAGLSIDEANGVIDLAGSTPGTYTVSYAYVSFGYSDVATASVTVLPLPAVNSVANRVVCAGSPLGPIAFSGTGTSYMWTNDNPAIGIPASGTGDIAAFIAQNGSTGTLTATLTVTAVSSGCASKPVTFRITVRPAPTVDAVSSAVLCAGSTFSAAFTGSMGGAATYSWTNNNTATGLAAAGTGSLSSFTAVNNTGVAQLATVTVVPSAGGCSGTPESFTLTVHPSAGTIAYSGSPYCPAGWTYVQHAGSAGGTFTAAPAGLAIDAATGAVNLAASAAGSYTVSYTVGAGGGSCASVASTQLTLSAATTVNALANQVFCAGVTTSALPFTGTATAYSWTNSNPGIGLAASGTGTSLPAFSTVNNGSTSASATIAVTPLGSGGCPSGKPITFRITVYPKVVLGAVPDQVYCKGVTASAVSFSANLAGATYSWSRTPAAIGLAASAGTGGIPSFVTQNAGAAPLSSTVTVTASANKCASAPITFQYQVGTCVTGTVTGGSGDAAARTASALSGLVIGPNPTQGRVTLMLEGKSGGTYTVRLLDQNGLALDKPASFTGSSYSLDLGGLPAGTYLVQLVDAKTGEQVQRKVIKL